MIKQSPMFHVIVHELTADKNEYGDHTIVRIVNAAAYRIAGKLSEKLRHVKCVEHPNDNQTITIIADRNEVVLIDKTNFCCQSFKDSIQIRTQ
jgi:hypothetical protein